MRRFIILVLLVYLSTNIFAQVGRFCSDIACENPMIEYKLSDSVKVVFEAYDLAYRYFKGLKGPTTNYQGVLDQIQLAFESQKEDTFELGVYYNVFPSNISLMELLKDKKASLYFYQDDTEGWVEIKYRVKRTRGVKLFRIREYGRHGPQPWTWVETKGLKNDFVCFKLGY